MPELRIIVRHAATVLAGQLAVMAFGITDTIVAGRFSGQALAALSVGSAVYITVYVALMGVLQALLPVWAELHGANRPLQLGQSVRQSLYLAGLGMVIGVIALLFPGILLDLTGVPEAMQGDVRAYLAVLAFALPPALLVRLYTTLNQGIGHPHLVMWLQVASLGVKVPLTIWFAFGGAGLPAMGAPGCAWATAVVNYLFVFTAIWLMRRQILYAPYRLWQRMEAPHWPTIAQFAKLGVPAGLTITVEVTSFTLMALFIARQGTLASAAHQIASNLAAVMFMVPLSIAIATSSRVSFWLGAGDARTARACVRTGLKLGLCMAIAMSITLFVTRSGIAAVYSSDARVVAAAGTLLAWLAVYHLGDAAQGMLVFILRSYRVTLAPLVAYCLLLWGLGLGGGFALAYTGIGPWPAQHSPAAFWIAAAIALAIISLILPVILWRAVRSFRPA